MTLATAWGEVLEGARLAQQLCDHRCPSRTGHLSYTRMERTVTRRDLASAVVHILQVNGVPDPEDAVEILGSPGNGTRLFALIPSERAKVVLEEELMRITGHRHPTAGDVWILDEAQSLALIQR